MFGLMLFAAMQVQAQGVLVNYDLDTSVAQIAKPLKLWKDFLATRDDSLGARYWSKAEVRRYGNRSYFLLKNELDFGMDNFLELLGYACIKILKIQKAGDNYKISSLMEFKPEGGKSNVQYIFHVYLKEEDGELKICNAQSVNDPLYMKQTQVGLITYHYPRDHAFDKALAAKQSDFIAGFAAHFGVKPDSMHYYFAGSLEDVQRIKGLDYIIGNNGEQYPSGKADPAHKTVYSFGLAEYYPHELIHLVLHKQFRQMHPWFDEGVATCFGMSRGKSLEWHLKRTNTYLAAHPEVDLTNMLQYRSIDAITDYRYVLGGFLVQYAYEKGGYPLIRRLLESGSSDEQFYKALTDHLGLERSSLNTWIRSELKKRYGAA